MMDEMGSMGGAKGCQRSNNVKIEMKWDRWAVQKVAKGVIT